MNKAKEATKTYHQNLYSTAQLFEKGTWLEKSDNDLLELVQVNFADKDNVRVLDIGSGVGRNAIPVAKIIGPKGGKVVCIDFLNIAIEKLRENAQKYDVTEVIEAHVQDIETYSPEKESFDLVVAFSSLEHGVSSEESFFETIRRIQQGTQPGGINYLGITTNLEELDAETQDKLPSDIEYRASYEDASRALRDAYDGWGILSEAKSPYEERYIKDGRMIVWRNDFLTFVVKKL